MENKTLIYQKLEAFIKKFYLNELLRGLIFFFGLGLLYLLFTAFIEYFLWLPPFGRTFLFVAFISVQVFLLFRFILFPVCWNKLFGLANWSGFFVLECFLSPLIISSSCLFSTFFIRMERGTITNPKTYYVHEFNFLFDLLAPL